MKRRKFIRNLSLGTAATIGAPYLLPSGRLFAAESSFAIASWHYTNRGLPLRKSGYGEYLVKLANS